MVIKVNQNMVLNSPYQSIVNLIDSIFRGPDKKVLIEIQVIN
jgi:hypothetical protein